MTWSVCACVRTIVRMCMSGLTRCIYKNTGTEDKIISGLEPFLEHDIDPSVVL